MTTSDVPAPRITGGQIAAAVMGNALEFYDFTTYALFSQQIGDTFFPAKTEFEKLMFALLTFAVGFIARPIGAVVLGALGDRIGRRPAMLISFTMMGAGLVGIVLTPSYATIGAAAPVLLVAFRIIQGFALGGEVGPTTAFLIEAAPAARRGFIGSWQSGSQGAASLAGAVIAFVLAKLLVPAELTAYGWRIAFGVGALILPLGLILRRRLPETLHRTDPAAPVDPGAPTGMTGLLGPILLGLGMIMSFTTSTYVLLYMTTYASQTLHMSHAAAFGASVSNGACGLIFAVLGGFLSDRFGRKPVMITARVLFLLAIWPAFILMVSRHDAITLITATGVLSMFSSTSVGVALVALTESLRKDVRSTAMAVIYAVGVAVFGGMVQPAVAGVIKATGSAMAPAWYLMGAALIGIIAMSFLRETHPDRIVARAVIETA